MNIPENFNTLTLREKIEHLLASTVGNKEGWSLDSKGNLQDSKESGFAVSITDNKFDIAKLRIETNFALEYLNGAFQHSPERIVGYWFDEAEGQGYFDIGYNVNTERQAVELAKTYNQKAYWDYKHKDAIFLT